MKYAYLVLIIVLTFTGCCSTKEINNVKDLPLKQTRWEIESINSVKIDSSKIYLLFGENGKLRGNAGCNSMGGSYEVSEGKIIFGNIITTKMACRDLDKENLFLKAIQKADKYKIKNNSLYIFSGDVEVLEFIGKNNN